MESFYGGRQGASFVIKRRFDCISRDIEIGDGTKQFPDYVKYSFKYFKYSEEKEAFIVVKNDDKYSLIERQLDNYSLQPLYTWRAVLCDGKSFIDAKFINIDEDNNTIEISINEIDNIPAEKFTEGMLELFKDGISTLNEVNYGEYVLISNEHNNYPYNGQVYKRGFDKEDGWYGAEYIGNIIGPQGNPLDLAFVAYDVNKEGKHFAPTLVSGTEVEKHNNEIKVQYQEYRDKLNNINRYDIGLQIPYHVFNFSSNTIDYYNNATATINEQEDSKNNNFYHNYLLSIPKGVHGDTTHITILKGYVKEGVSYFSDSECTQEVGKLKNITKIMNEIDYDIDKEPYHKIQLQEEQTRDNIIYYILRGENDSNLIYDTLYEKRVVYDAKDKDEKGTVFYSFIANYNSIENIELKSDGSLVVYYSGVLNEQIQANKIKWIKNTAVVTEEIYELLFNQGIENLPFIGNLIVQYNTPKEEDIKYYNWSVDGTIANCTSDWILLGMAQNLTGVKIYAHDDNFDGTSDNYNDIPDGWAVSANKDKQTICYVKHTKDKTVEWAEVPLIGGGGSADLVNPTTNAGVDTLEEELLFGHDTIVRQKVLNNGNIQIITEYRNDDIKNNYYILTSEVMAEGQEESINIKFEDGVLIFLRHDDAVVENNTLKVLDSDLISNNFEIALEKIIKTDVLSYKGAGDEAIDKFKKITTMQLLADGTQILREKNMRVEAAYGRRMK